MVQKVKLMQLKLNHLVLIILTYALTLSKAYHNDLANLNSLLHQNNSYIKLIHRIQDLHYESHYILFISIFCTSLWIFLYKLLK